MIITSIFLVYYSSHSALTSIIEISLLKLSQESHKEYDEQEQLSGRSNNVV